MHDMAQWLVDTVFDFGYFGVFLLMAIESSFIPFPSEIVLIPAGYLASKGEMSISLIMIFSVLGSIVGALINYGAALYVGRNFLLKYGKYVLISHGTLDKMDDFFKAHGAISTFTGRLIPGVRQLISVPAGLSKMDLKLFVIYTSLGAGIWSSVLVVLGFMIGENEALIKEYLSQIITITLVIVALILALYFYKNKKNSI